MAKYKGGLETDYDSNSESDSISVNSSETNEESERSSTSETEDIKKYETLKDLLLDTQVGKDDDYTHTSMGGQCIDGKYVGSKWYIEDIEQFYKLYIEQVGNSELLLTEKHQKEISPILIDLDIKYNEGVKSRQIKKTHYREVVRIILEYLRKYVDTKEDFTTYVLMRKNSYKKKETHKDGIHIMIPNIVTKYEFQFQMRKDLLSKVGEVFNDIECEHDNNDIYDESVIKRNNWCIYMSTKKDIMPYIIREIFETENVKEDIELYLELCIRNKERMSKYKSNIESIKIDLDKEIDTSNIAGPSSIVKKEDGKEKKYDNKYITREILVNILENISNDRKDTYQSWFEITSSIKSINVEYIDIWLEWSKGGKNYNMNKNMEIWSGLTKCPYKLGTLLNILKDDNIEAFNIIMEKKKEEKHNELGMTENMKIISKNQKELGFKKKEELEIVKTIKQSDNGCMYVLSKKYKCPFIERIDSNHNVYLEMTSRGLSLKCNNMDCLGKYKPDPMIPNTNQYFINNGTIINNYGDKDNKEIKLSKKELNELKTFLTEKYIIISDPEYNKIIINSIMMKTSSKIADAFYYKYKNKFNYSDGIWYYYDKHLWKIDTDGALFDNDLRNGLNKDYIMIGEYITKIYNDKLLQNDKNIKQYEAYETVLTKKIEELVFKLEENGSKESIQNDAKKIFKLNNPKFKEKLDSKVNLIGFDNGVFDLDIMEFREGTPEDYISISVGYDYDKTSKSEELMEMIKKILPNENVRIYLLKVLGYCLYGKNEIQKFFIWSGTGANGKSALLELIQCTIQSHCETIDVGLLMQKRKDANSASPELTKTLNKRLIVMSETNPEDKFNTATLKTLTGNDRVSTRGLYKDSITFKPYYKMILLCNNLPHLDANNSNSHSIWRRLRNIKFESLFLDNPNPNNKNEYKLDSTLSDKFEEWRPSFMNLLIKFYKKFKEEGLDDIPEIMESTNEYKDDNDMYKDYIDENIEITNHSDDYIKGDILTDKFIEWYKSSSYYKSGIKLKKSDIDLGIDSYFNKKKLNIKKTTIYINNTKNVKGWKYIKLINLDQLEDYSKFENKCNEILNKMGYKYTRQHIFMDCRDKDVLYFDFYVNDQDIKLIIETDGKQHYEYTSKFHKTEEDFKNQQRRDKIKDEYCKRKDINMLRIKYDEEDKMKEIIERRIEEIREKTK